MTHPLRDQAAIVGVGRTEYSRNSGVSTLTLALRAIKDALDDAGLTVADVDGVACHRVGDSAQAAVVAQSLGIRDLRSHHDLWGGGSQSMWAIGSAAMAVATGTAECVVVWRSVNARSEFRMGGTGRAAPDAIEFQYQTPYWYATPPQQFAMYARAYMHDHGVTAEDLGRVAIAQRDFGIGRLARTGVAAQLVDGLRAVVEPVHVALGEMAAVCVHRHGTTE